MSFTILQRKPFSTRASRTVRVTVRGERIRISIPRFLAEALKLEYGCRVAVARGRGRDEGRLVLWRAPDGAVSVCRAGGNNARGHDFLVEMNASRLGLRRSFATVPVDFTLSRSGEHLFISIPREAAPATMPRPEAATPAPVRPEAA